MKTGSSGTFVITWTQTETEGVIAPPLDLVKPGASWRWTGAATRVDGPAGLLRLAGAERERDLRQRAARVVRRLIGPKARPLPSLHDQDEPTPSTLGITVTDGLRSFPLAVLVTPGGSLLLAAHGDVPPVDCELWIAQAHVEAARPIGPSNEGVICFTPGTRIATPRGTTLVEELRPGDLILTRDNGPQPVLWTGRRMLSGARLYAQPSLRPIRLRGGALGRDLPAPDLTVSPHHRMLVRGRAARALFDMEEVLVRAVDLVNDRTITVDRAARSVTYVHILLERHNLIWANGLATESFHPGLADLAMLEPDARDALTDLLPDPLSYGDPARRALSSAEAAILAHDMPALAC